MIENDERLSVYNLSAGALLTSPIEKKIKRICSDKVVLDYVRKLKYTNVLYECSKCTVYGTAYKYGNFVLLPESTFHVPVFAKICKVLCCEEYCHLYYKKTTHKYCSKTDLYMISEQKSFGVVRADHLADYHVLNGYKVGEAQRTSISLRNYFLDHV